jgi:hypothetical protein
MHLAGIIYLSHQLLVYCCVSIRTQGLLEESQQNRDNDAGLNGFSKAYEKHCWIGSTSLRMDHFKVVSDSPGTANTFTMIATPDEQKTKTDFSKNIGLRQTNGSYGVRSGLI